MVGLAIGGRRVGYTTSFHPRGVGTSLARGPVASDCGVAQRLLGSEGMCFTPALVAPVHSAIRCRTPVPHFAHDYHVCARGGGAGILL